MGNNTTYKSAITEGLAIVLESLLDEDIDRRQISNVLNEYLFVSYAEDFEYIWDLENEDGNRLINWVTSDGNKKQKNLILVWDGIPQSHGTTINIADYVTPYDWALAFSWRILTKFNNDTKETTFNQPKKLPKLRIYILDIASESFSDSFGCKTAFILSYALPWIQIYKPIGNDTLNQLALSEVEKDSTALSLLRSSILSGSFGIDSMYLDLITPSRVLSLYDVQSERTIFDIVKSLVNLWQSNLVKPVDRHHVGNLIAPMLLSGGLPETLKEQTQKNVLEGHILRNALKTFLDVIGLTKNERQLENTSIENGLLATLQSETNVFGHRNNIKICLIDDQYDLGYQHILGSLLFGQKYIASLSNKTNGEWKFSSGELGELRCNSTPEVLFQFFDNITEPIKDWKSPRVYNINGGIDILLLDLRLWANASDRKKLLGKLVDVCKRIGAEAIADTENDFFDPHFKKALESAEILAGSDSNKYEEVDALCLLPLLLSYYDPSLPIILFSSTHQRAVIELTAHRANIITNFAKPILSGYGEESAPYEYIDNLIAAFRRAVELHESRFLWEIICKTDWTWGPVFEVQNNRKVMSVYNTQVSFFPERKDNKMRISKGNCLPKISGDKLKNKLAEQYVYYIEKKCYVDFLTVPWEVLEGNLVPNSILKNPDNTNPSFSLSSDLDSRNYVAQLLQVIRNKKAHGGVSYSRVTYDENTFRICAILGFVFFLDFLNRQSVNKTSNKPTDVKYMENYLAKKYRHLKSTRKLSPHKLTADSVVDWLDFVVFSAIFSINKACSITERYFSAKTILIVERLVNGLLSNRLLPNQKNMKTLN